MSCNTSFVSILSIYESILKKFYNGKKQFALLLDPDEYNPKDYVMLTDKIRSSKVDVVLVGGSLLLKNNLDVLLKHLRENLKIPVILFPGNLMQLSPYADALLFMSLVSGRNPDLLIGQQVLAAPQVKQLNLEPISTGYMLVDRGAPTAVSYMSNSIPIPGDKNSIAVATAMAAEMLGSKLIYMDGGSGAKTPITGSMIQDVKQQISVPLIVGGGINTPEKVYNACKAGADVVVVGNIIEKNIDLLRDMVAATKTTINEDISSN